ncbi:hypothetical protein ASE75_08445 [Sphingomonas sp. Leaf17]|uniref:UrcA family protein n=1 Tax=Sphingomonas sp. Leaf17 TaxID=1735683 RepID=UPI0007005CC3|nr:UrcA family protein [Sphingomonas sp. Leaf17]KQM65064.1 hypothetical protein ASE75_08445 [Sphingomonas sp. Leaf17]
MSIIRIAVLAVTAAACLSSTAQAEMRDAVTVRVRHADLNLTRAADRAMFDIRVRRAANIACVAQGSDRRMRRDAERCKAEMRADGSNKAALIAARATPTLLAGIEPRR